MICKNIKINGRRTSLRMEACIWAALGDVAARRGLTVPALVGDLDRERGEQPLTQHLRVYLLGYYRTLVGSLEGYGMTRAAMDEFAESGVGHATVQ